MPGEDQEDAGAREARSRSSLRQGLAYQGAFEAVFAILIGSGIGLWADSHFDTSPRYLLLGMGIGFAGFVLRLIRLGRQLQEDQDDGRDDGPGAGDGPG